MEEKTQKTIVLLILAVAGGVFAQEVKISGYVNTGLEGGQETYDAGSKVTSDKFRTYAHDADDGVGLRADINVDAIVNEQVEVHAKFRTQGSPTDPIDQYWAYLPYAYGKVTAFEIVDIYGGLVDNEAWKTKGDKADDVGEGLGGLVQIRPIEGLNIGFGVYGTAGSGNLNSDKQVPGGKGGNTNDTIFLDQIFTYGFSYTMADTFRVEASGKTEGQWMRQLFAGAEIFAIPNLTLALEGWSKTLANKDIGWTFDIAGAYKINDNIDVGATLWLFMNNLELNGMAGGIADAFHVTEDDLKAMTSKYFLGFKAKVWGSYIFGDFVPKLEAWGGYQGVDKDLMGKKVEILYLGVKPSVTWNVAENAKLVAGYEFDWGQAKSDAFTETIKYMKNLVSVDFIYTF